MFIVGKSFFSETLSKFNIQTIAPLFVIHTPWKIYLSKNLPVSISILESTLYNKQLSEGLSITLYSLGNTTGEASANVEEFVSVNEYGACDRYDFTETDKTAGYQADALRFSKDLINFYKRYP